MRSESEDSARGERRRLALHVVAAGLSIGVALLAAWGMRDRVRTVDIVALFAGGVGAGTTLVNLVRTWRARRSGQE